MWNLKDNEEHPEPHSFIVIKDPTKPESSLIFDISRPLSDQNLPRVLETEVPFTYELLQNKDDLLVEATEVLKWNKMWFGVWDHAAGGHKTIKEV